MRVTLRVAGGGRERDADATERRLADHLDEHRQLRGRVRLVDEARKSGGISQSIATVIVELGPAGGVALGGALVAWIRHRTADVRVTVRRPDGRHFEVSAQRVRGLGSAQLNELAAQIADAVAEPGDAAPDRAAAGHSDPERDGPS